MKVTILEYNDVLTTVSADLQMALANVQVARCFPLPVSIICHTFQGLVLSHFNTVDVAFITEKDN